MGENSKIEWTDHTFNPWIGCTKVAAGCTRCYAEALAKRTGKAKWGPEGTRVKTSEAYWRQPLKWNREAEELTTEALRTRRRVFCASLADVFEDRPDFPVFDHLGRYGIKQGDPVVTEWLDRDPGPPGYPKNCVTLADLRADLFALIDATPHLDWLLLTKRPENILKMWPTLTTIASTDRREIGKTRPRRLENVWLGTSIATQEDADKNLPELLKCRELAPVLFLSAEPLLGPIDLRGNLVSSDGFVCPDGGATIHVDDGGAGVDWLIVGGESGHGAKPMHPNWARSLRDHCERIGTPFFFKQWGEWKPISEMADGESDALYKSNRVARDFEDQGRIDEAYGRQCKVETKAVRFDGLCSNGIEAFRSIDGHHGYKVFRVGKKAAGRLLDVREHSEFPQVATAEARR